MTQLRPDDLAMDDRIREIRARDFWKGWQEKPCRACGEPFVPHARAAVFCPACRQARLDATSEAACEEESRRSEAGTSQVDTAAASPFSPSPRALPSWPAHLVETVEPGRAGFFSKVTPKSCACGASGEWPGRLCGSCREQRGGLVRPVFGRKASRRRAA